MLGPLGLRVEKRRRLLPQNAIQPGREQRLYPNCVFANPAFAPHPAKAVRLVDMNASNSWAEFAGLFRDTQGAHADHERAKCELEALVPEGGHGSRHPREAVKIGRD